MASMSKEHDPAFVDRIIAYEQGDLDDAEVLALFSDLIKDGMIRHLQGSYQRSARWFITNGYLDDEGNILKEVWYGD